MTAAPLDLVVSVYGGGGLRGEQGLEAIFGGSAFFRDDDTGATYLAVWSSRKAARFRKQLRASGASIEIIRDAPAARLISWTTHRRDRRPHRG